MEVEEANYKRKLSRSTEDQVVPEKQRVSIEVSIDHRIELVFDRVSIDHRKYKKYFTPRI